jgi:tetratricopeptide (TPR) repeat protein
MAAALLDRGELSAALRMTRRGLENLSREQNPTASAVAVTWLGDAVVATKVGDFNRAANALAQAQVAAQDVPLVEDEMRFSSYHRAHAIYLLSIGDAAGALDACERTRSIEYVTHVPAQQRASTLLMCAKALLALGEVQHASESAQDAWAAVKSVQGIMRHVYVPYREALAEVLLVQQRPYEALAEIEAGRQDFDSVQVLDNRLAHLDFLEAKARWLIDESRAGKVLARELAKKSLERYRDWDLGGQRELREVRSWLATHRI